MKTEDEQHGELTGQDTGNTSPAEPTEGQIKKPPRPPKKQVTVQSCELCNVILTSQTIVDAHMGSRRHKKRALASESQKTAIGQKKVAVPNTPLHRCDICNITLNSLQQKEFHLAGMKHTYKVKKIAEANEVGQGKDSSMIVNPTSKAKEAAAPVSVPTGGSITDTDPSVPVQQADLKCTVCSITVNSVQQLTQHLSSKKHQSKEEGLQRAAPYHRSRRGGLGRGAPAPSGDPGAPGPRGRGRGRGWGRGRVGDGPKLGRINSLKSNFQSAGFTSNFQSLSGSQSLKRDRSPRNEMSFGNGSNEDFCYNSYHQGKKIPRGKEIPFHNLDSMDHNSFRSGNNAFGGGNSSFGGGKPSFGCGGGSSFEGGSNAFAGGNSLFGVGKPSFGSGGGSSFEGGNNAFGGKSSFGGTNKPFGSGRTSFGGGNKSFGRGKPLFGGGSTSFEGGSSSFGCGNNFFGGGNDLYAGGHGSLAGVESSFGSANTFGDSNNPPRGGFGRGGRGGPRRRGRGFGQRGRGPGSLAQESNF